MRDRLENGHGYRYSDASLNASHEYLLPAVLQVLQSVSPENRVFELGCGNGSIANELTKYGFDMTGIDPSPEGLQHAKQQYPHLNIFSGSAYDDLTDRFGKFPIVLSLEVIEHLYFPRQFASAVYKLLLPGGMAVISTPYHGYWKNLVLSLFGKMDDHFTALWDYGHIKFWSIKTLTELLQEAGFDEVLFLRVGRIPSLAKSMIAVAKKGK